MIADFSILGCGWLGFPLAKFFLEEQFIVNGSTTRENKIHELKDKGIQPFLISVEKNRIEGDIQAFLKAHTLIINIPPGRKNPNVKEDFIGKMHTLLEQIDKSPLEHVLFVSSTSVYGGCKGIVNEGTRLDPITPSGSGIAESERLLQASLKSVTIVRPGGLVGPNRNPGRFLAGRKDIPSGDSPVNLIHLQDLIHIIHLIIEKQYWNREYNVVADLHPTKKEFYTLAASSLGLEVPQFLSGGEDAKWIQNEKVKMDTQYNLLFANPFAMLSKTIERKTSFPPFS